MTKKTKCDFVFIGSDHEFSMQLNDEGDSIVFIDNSDDFELPLTILEAREIIHALNEFIELILERQK